MPQITRETQTEVYDLQVAVKPGQEKMILLITCRECKAGCHLEGHTNKTSALQYTRRYKGWTGGGNAGWLCPDCKTKKARN